MLEGLQTGGVAIRAGAENTRAAHFEADAVVGHGAEIAILVDDADGHVGQIEAVGAAFPSGVKFTAQNIKR